MAMQDKDLIYRPRNKLDLTVTFRYVGIEVNILGQEVGKLYTTASNTQCLNTHSIAEANTGYGFNTLGIYWSTESEVNNFTNIHYFAVDKTPVPGREYRFTRSVSI